MKKKFYGALLVGSLFLAGGMVSCSDYDDDINSLNERVGALEKTVAELQKAIEAGAVITSVESTENGVKVTLSNGEPFEIKNGTNGKDGSVVEIKEVDGVKYWFLDNKNTGYHVTGNDGEDGKDGIYYSPNATTGTWWKYDPNIENDKGTDTGISYVTPGTVTAVYDTEAGVLTFKNVEGAPDGTVVIPLYTNDLQSIAFIPECYDKEMGMGVIDFYTILKNDKVLTSTNAVVNYRLNPNNADINDIKFDFIDRVVETRAAGDAYQLLSVVGEPERQAGGEIKLTAKANSSLKDLETNEEAIVALRAQKTENGKTSEIVSDYAVVSVDTLTDFAIIDKADYVLKYVYKYELTQEAVEAQTSFDGTIEYDSENKTTSQLNLLTLVETYASQARKGQGATLNELEVAHTYKFTALDYTPINGDGTNQKEFIEFVDENTVQINKKWLANGIAAVDKTPIIKIESLVEGEVIATAFIKLQIVQKDRTVKNVEINLGDIEYTTIDPAKKYALPWKQMNEEVLDQLGLTNAMFSEIYKPTDFSTTEGALEKFEWDKGDEVGTDICGIKLNSRCKTGDQKVVFTYSTEDNKAYPVINITFTYNLFHTLSFPDLNPDYKDADGAILVKGRLVGTQWKMNSEVAEHFENYLDGYTAPKYHTYPTLSIINEGTNNVGVAIISGTDITNQVIALTEPLTVNTKDVKVRLSSTMNNGEVCTKDYVVRFLNPYKLSLSEDVILKTFASKADTKDLRDYIVITDRSGKVLYENQKYTDEAKSTYKLDQAGMTFAFDLVEDPSFGDKLQILDDGYTISWNNGGNDLQNNKSAQYNVTVTVPEIAKLTTTPGNITVYSTENSK